MIVDGVADAAMARTIGKLTALSVTKAKRAGLYADGGGLYLRVTPEGTKNWVFRFMLNGRARWMGVGPLHTISLAEARTRVAACRMQRLDGIALKSCGVQPRYRVSRPAQPNKLPRGFVHLRGPEGFLSDSKPAKFRPTDIR
jgi:hypothetical protein